MFTVAIFDVDGTILDTEEAILKSLQRTLKAELNLNYEKEELTFALGIPGKEALNRLRIQDVEKIQSVWAKNVLSFVNEVKVFEQIEAVIKQLTSKQIKLGIVTSKTSEEMFNEFDQYGLNHYFSKTITASHTEKHKPHPDPLLACINQLAVEKEKAVYIGDSIYDLQCAKSAGVKFALALWGSKTQEGYEEADYVLNQPADCLKLF
ncbi:HAD family hydrolase [Oceanobacillus sp. CFH 90083]|uniref:HAD family hydrolase n=1 Tax=Oceanobacillus sp. CFH 90083 TaxID=2592336 RepID=UPI00128B64A3|nr:HAD family hydrolase [Oceanobacillus sp. CFH 90083]